MDDNRTAKDTSYLVIFCCNKSSNLSKSSFVEGSIPSINPLAVSVVSAPEMDKKYCSQNFFHATVTSHFHLPTNFQQRLPSFYQIDSLLCIEVPYSVSTLSGIQVICFSTFRNISRKESYSVYRALPEVCREFQGYPIDQNI